MYIGWFLSLLFLLGVIVKLLLLSYKFEYLVIVIFVIELKVAFFKYRDFRICNNFENCFIICYCEFKFVCMLKIYGFVVYLFL